MLLAQESQETLLEAYGMIVMIAAIGLAAVILVLSVIVARRMSRRRLVLLEREIEKRRNEPGVPHEDVWKTGSERYVDTDRLTPEEIAQRAAESAGEDDDDDDSPASATWDDAIASEDDNDPGEDDPFGLFEDKPYVDPQPDDDEDLEDGVDPDEPWR